MPKTILITIDVEDWFQVENLRPWFPPSAWDTQQSRVERNTRNLLDLLDAANQVKATFFVLGWIAQRHPGLVKEIAARGHEVASHGCSHTLCNQMNREDLLQDLRTSKQILQDLTGTEIQGFRAPSFSINDRALDLVHQTGYRYDSSYNSFDLHGRYGTITTNGHRTDRLFEPKPGFFELPISNLNLAGQTIPWGGGGYFRLTPPPIFKAGIRKILNKTNTYLFYMHPWELDPNQPRVKKTKGTATWRHYLNLRKTRNRLQELIQTFKHHQFQTCRQYINKPSTPSAPLR